MVRAIQVNSLGFVEWLLRLRPGIAISLALHVALLLFLAIVLAFPPRVAPTPTEDRTRDIEMIEPVLGPRVEPRKTPVFNPTPTLDQIDTTVKPLTIPAMHNLERRAATTVTVQETKAEAPPPEPLVIINPRAISRGGLVYPSRASDLGKSGYVDFSFTIEPDGSVGNAEVIEESPMGYGFADAARKAFPKWRFEPKLVDGKPVAAPARIRVSFKQE